MFDLFEESEQTSVDEQEEKVGGSGDREKERTTVQKTWWALVGKQGAGNLF